MTRPFRLFVVAGEASGDALGARFVARLSEVLGERSLKLSGVGGEALLARLTGIAAETAVVEQQDVEPLRGERRGQR